MLSVYFCVYVFVWKNTLVASGTIRTLRVRFVTAPHYKYIYKISQQLLQLSIPASIQIRRQKHS